MTAHPIGNLDARLMRTLLILLTECSVSKTADILGQAQPTISLTLKRLRQIFDDPLLVRSGNSKVAASMRSLDGVTLPPLLGTYAAPSLQLDDALHPRRAVQPIAHALIDRDAVLTEIAERLAAPENDKELTARTMVTQLMPYLKAFHRDNPLPQTEGSYRYNAIG